MVRALLPLVCLGGCTYVTQKVYEEKLSQIDQDRDGVGYGPDCNDRDPDVFPEAPETPYDGVDDDCDGADLVDIDGDGFPGITLAAYEALESPVAFPEALRDKPLDCADDPAVHPTAAQIFPDPSGSIDVLYDAIDSDCQKDNDFDGDGDGFLPDTVVIDGDERLTSQVFEEYLVTWEIPSSSVGAWAPPGHPAPLVGDCDDTDPTVHPENSQPEVFYDGIDRDCDHHNDFDVDGDCFMPPGAEPLYGAYVTAVYGIKAPPFCVDAELPFGDCLDEPDPTITSLPAPGVSPDPAAVHPDTAANPNPDAPYDGIDTDCAANNDFDADDDGFMADQQSSAVELMNTYAAMWGYEDLVGSWALVNPDAGLATPVSGDCDDSRTDTWPGALELLGDGVDQDCAGDPDAARFGFGDASGDYDWTGPTNPEIARLGDSFLVLVGARSGSIPTLEQEFGVAIPFDLSGARGGAAPAPVSFPFWKASFVSLAIQGRLDVALAPNPVDTDGDGIPDPILHTLSNSDSSIIFYTYLNVNGVKLQTADNVLLSSGISTNDFVPTSYVANGIDLVMDGDGNPFALACATDRLHAVYSLDVPPPHSSITTGGGDTCFFDSAPTQTSGTWSTDVTLCEDGACESWGLTQQPVFTNESTTGESWVYGDQDDGWISLVDATGEGFVRAVGGIDLPVFPGRVVNHLDVSETGGTLYVAAILEGVDGPEVWIAFGPVGNLVESALPFDDPSVDGEIPQSVAVYADADRVAVAVSAVTGDAGEDSVGWVFLGP